MSFEPEKCVLYNKPPKIVESYKGVLIRKDLLVRKTKFPASSIFFITYIYKYIGMEIGADGWKTGDLCRKRTGR